MGTSNDPYSFLDPTCSERIFRRPDPPPEGRSTGGGCYNERVLCFARWAALSVLLGTLFLCPSPGRAQVRDRGLRWHQIESEHFTLAYHEPLGVLARHALARCERAHAIVSEILDHDLEGRRGRVYVVLTDGTDSANGSATSLPYNTMRLFASAPSDLSALGDVDDWLQVLITHEHTHVLHLDTVGGVPSLVNRLLGKVLSPNLVQPRWFIEGLATHMESRESTGGRLRSSMFRMFMRMDAIEDRLLRLDQLSSGVDRWPRGNAAYLYGAHFVEFIAQRHGRQALTRISHDYGRRLIPYGINRAANRAFGEGFVELYDAFRDELRQESQALVARIEAEGRIEGERLTRHGDTARSPRFLDDQTLVYYAGRDAQDPGLFRLPLDGSTAPALITRAAGTAYVDPQPDGSLIYSAVDTHANIYRFYDLFRRSADGDQERLTHGRRAREPTVHGQRVAFTQNGAGTTHLMIADLADVDGTAEVLLRNPRMAQVYTPRFSPDGRTIALSRWTVGGDRDIVLVDVATGETHALTDDRALDTGPAWSADGRFLYFSSDRTGIANIYRYTVETGELVQVTNVVAGAYSPAISPDGRTLVYVGYTSYGFDLMRLDLTEVTPRPATPYVDDRGEAPSIEPMVVTSSRYQARHTLWPRSYSLDFQSTTRGNQLGVLVSQTDIAGHYEYAARLGVVLETGDVDVEAAFTFGRLQAPIRIGAYRRINERGGFVVGGRRRLWVEESVGVDIQTSYVMPRAFSDHSVYGAYALSYNRNLKPLGGRIDPNTPPPIFPDRGRFATLRFGYGYSDARHRLYDMVPSAGRAIRLDATLAHAVIGSRYTSASLRWSWRRYLTMPWGHHHTLALRYGGGIGVGDAGRRRFFGVGGFPNSSILNAVVDGTRLGGVALRGYPVNARVGTQMHLAQLEYHFPIVRIMAGVDTLPAYIRRLHAAVFVDTGNAFRGSFDPADLAVGAGAELYTDIQLGYILSFRLRLGLAYGFMDGGGLHGYFHVGSPF